MLPPSLMALKTLLALVRLATSPLYSTPLTACESAASRMSITVIVELSATPKAAPLVPTLYVAVATPLPLTVKPYCVPTPVL